MASKNRIPDPSLEKYRTIEGLKEHPAWKQLTDKQKTFVLTYIETNGDKMTSVKTAFRVRSDNGAAGMASRLLRNYLVQNVLSAYYGEEITHREVGRTELLGIISTYLRRPNISTQEFYRLSTVYADLKGWRVRQRKFPKSEDPEEGDEGQQPPQNAVDVLKLVQQMEAMSK